jgi:lysyl-tRNA synthetase class I
MKCRKIKPGTNINYTKRSKTIKVKKALIRGIQIFNWSVKLNWKIDWKAKKTSTKVPRKTFF